jgi:predicted RNase H-like HicB family nuclease
VRMAEDALHFQMERFGDDGTYYVIRGVEIALVTDGTTIEEALHHLREAVALYYEGDNQLVVPMPKRLYGKSKPLSPTLPSQ